MSSPPSVADRKMHTQAEEQSFFMTKQGMLDILRVSKKRVRAVQKMKSAPSLAQKYKLSSPEGVEVSLTH